MSGWTVPILVAGLTVLAAVSVRQRWVAVPPKYDPWSTLDVSAPPNFLTRYKLSRLSTDDALCKQVLARTDIRFEPVADRVSPDYNAAHRDHLHLDRGPFRVCR